MLLLDLLLLAEVADPVDARFAATAARASPRAADAAHSRRRLLRAAVALANITADGRGNPSLVR